MPVYIAYDGGTPYYVDKEGYRLIEDSGRFFYTDVISQLLDDQGFVVNNQGIRLDTNGDFVNQYGYIIDQYGNFLNQFDNPINAYGDRVDQYGNLIAIDGVTLISADGYKINSAGLLLNAGSGLLNGVGAIRGSVDISSTFYLTDQYGNLVSSNEELVTEISGVYYLVNERGDLIDENGIPIAGFQTPVVAAGTPVVVVPATIEAPVPGGSRWNAGSIQPGAAPLATTGRVLIDLPARRSGGLLNTTGPTGHITITGDKDIEILGMVGKVYLDETTTPASTAVDVVDIDITSLDEVYIWTDALVNAKDNINITGTNVWALDESVTIARADYSELHMTATGSLPDAGRIYIARSEIYYFEPMLRRRGLLN